MYTVGEFAKLIKRNVKTLQRWDRADVLKPSGRTITNRRYYTHQQLLDYFNNEIVDKMDKLDYAYARVSSINKKTDLQHQVLFLENWLTVNQAHVDDILTDIGSGLNYKRKNFLKLVNLVTNNKVGKIYVTHKDRLTRFGFEMIEEICKKFKTEIIVINEEKTSPTEELVKDLTSIVHVFSSRLYGLRKYKNKAHEICSENKD